MSKSRPYSTSTLARDNHDTRTQYAAETRSFRTTSRSMAALLYKLTPCVFEEPLIKDSTFMSTHPQFINVLYTLNFCDTIDSISPVDDLGRALITVGKYELFIVPRYDNGELVSTKLTWPRTGETFESTPYITADDTALVYAEALDILR